MRRFLLLFVPLLLTACASPDPGIIRFGLASAPVSLDPRFATDAASSRINRLLYRRLVDFDARLRPVPALAKWQQLSPTVYRFVLRRENGNGAGQGSGQTAALAAGQGVGRTFHDGSYLTATDVAATYRSVLDKALASPHRGALKAIRRIEVVDDDTVDFFLDQPDVLFPGRLTLGILPAALIAADHPFTDQPVGSGPFRFVQWPQQGQLRLQRIADNQHIEFIRVADPTVRVLKLLRGEVDLLQGDLPTELIAWLGRRDDVRVSKRPGSNFSYLGFNLQDPVVGQLTVRRAIAHALDREAIIRYVLGGAARPATAILPPDHWAGNPSLRPRSHDPDLARRLLAEAGYDNAHPLRITYKTSSDPFRIRLATIIQQQLRQVGIDVDLRSYDWGTFYGDIKAGRFQMYSLTWVGIKSPDIFRYVFHSQSIPPAGANRGRLIDATVDRLIERAGAALDTAQQALHYRELQARLLQQLPYVPLWYEDNVLVTGMDIESYSLAADGNYDGLQQVRRH